jgi:hypothetical protein
LNQWFLEVQLVLFLQ